LLFINKNKQADLVTLTTIFTGTSSRGSSSTKKTWQRCLNYRDVRSSSNS
jgi:hypothetical protein